jgi:Ca2+-binding RTX toxin-like protein
MPGNLDEQAGRPEGGRDFVVSVAYDVKGGDSSDRDTQDPSSPLEGPAPVQRGDAHVAQSLGIHQAGVSDTEFAKCEVCETLGMGQAAGMASFTAQSGEAMVVHRVSMFSDREEPAPVTAVGDGPDAGGAADGGNEGNTAPVVGGAADLGSMSEDASLLLTEADLLALASDIDGDTLSVTGLAVVSGSGSLADNGDGTWTFTPAADWNGSVSFSYTVSDGQGGTVPATVALTVSAVNDAPVVGGAVDLGSMNEDGSLIVTAAQLLAQASDIDGDTLSVTGLTVATGNGSLADNGDGTWTFTPAADWHGSVTFDYTVADNNGGTAAGSANLAVEPVNDAPVIEVNSVLLADDLTAQSLAGSLSATDAESGAADLWYTITQGPANGVLLLDGAALTDFSQPVFTQADIDNGRVSFRFNIPQPGAEPRVMEEDSFVFTVSDGSLGTAGTTFVIRGGEVQVWGTDGDDDLTGAADFSSEDTSFLVYGFDGNDTLRGGSGADTLDGGGHAYALDTPWLFTQEGGDTVDYGASTAAVDVDLTRETQLGGHAEGDSLVGIENVVGSAFDDSIAGNGFDNLLVGQDGIDTLLGGEGNDTLRGGAGADLIDGGIGQDFADYSDSASWVNVNLTLQDGITAQSGGGAGNHAEGDTLVGMENIIGSNDATHGDVLTGNTANNHLIGLDGNDTLVGGSGYDTLVGGAGADRLDGGTGIRDLADYSASTAWVNVNLTLQNGTTAQTGGGAGNHAEGDILTGIEDVNGSEYDDSIVGSLGSNFITAFGGNDTLEGGAGYDTIYGGDGNDLISGGTRTDSLYGDADNDTIYGGQDLDTIWGGAGDDYLVGGESNDGYTDVLFGGTGTDTLVAISGLSARDTLLGCQGADRIIGDGDSSVSYEITDDYFTVNFTAVYVDLRLQDGVTGQSGGEEGNDAIGDVLTGIQHATGTYGSDTLIGNHEINELDGVDGDDLLVGNEGDDFLWGMNGNDTMEGGEGADFIWGGMGFDIASYANAASGVNVTLELQLGPAQSGAGEENDDELWYMDGLWGSEFNDTLTGRNTDDPDYMSVHNLIEGRGGDDILAGLSGGDTLDGGTGSDTADYSLSTGAVNIDLTLQDGVTVQSGGAAGNDGDGDVLVSIENVTGSAFDDALMGDAGDNVLNGMGGSDILTGAAGDDILVAGSEDSMDGGSGFDTFRLADDAGTGGLLDLSALTGAGRITGVESVDVTGDADDANTLTLTAADVLDTTGGTDILWVQGDANDTVTTTDAGWTLIGTQVGADGHTYTHYTGYAGATLVNLLIDTDIAAQNVE